MVKRVTKPSSAPRPVGRPRTTGTGTMIAIRWHEPVLGGIDRYADEQHLDRSVALRQIVAKFLTENGFLKASARSSRAA